MVKMPDFRAFHQQCASAGRRLAEPPIRGPFGPEREKSLRELTP
jgi:hypothetical protein